MKEAIEAFLHPGDTLFMGGMQHGEPWAACDEIIRQGIDHLTFIGILNTCRGMMVVRA